MNKKYPDIDTGDYVNADSDRARVVELEKMFTASRDARRHRVAKWRRAEELYQGKILAPFGLPKYKSKIEPNIIHSVIETSYAIFTDRNPVVDVMPRREDQIQQAKMAQEILHYTMSKKKAQRAVNNMKRDGLLYGNGYIKIAVIDDEIEFICCDPFTVFIDPLATNLQDAKCVTFATPSYVDDVMDTYGKKVTPEGAMNEYMSFVKHDEKYASDKATSADILKEISPTDSKKKSADSLYRGGQVILKESWYYRGSELWLSTWCGNILLQDKKSPYPFIPLVTFQNYQSGHTIYGKGEPEVIESLAVGASIALSQAMDNLVASTNPAMVMSKSLAKTQGNRPSDKPGQVYYVNSPADIIQRLPAASISPASLPMAETMMSLADTISGIHEVSRGFNPTGVTAGKAIQQLQEASQQIIRAKEREVGTEAVVELYRMTLHLLAKNYSKPISIRRRAEDGTGYEFIKVQPYNLDPDMDFHYVPGSAMPESRANRMDQAIDLLQLGLLDQESFWLWTQRDITQDKLDEIAKARAEKQQALQAEMDTISNSTDEDEILDSLLRSREISGMGQETDQILTNRSNGGNVNPTK